MNDKHTGNWTTVVITYIKLLSQHFPLRGTEIMKNLSQYNHSPTGIQIRHLPNEKHNLLWSDAPTTNNTQCAKFKFSSFLHKNYHKQ
jgi:hypothetical protein